MLVKGVSAHDDGGIVGAKFNSAVNSLAPGSNFKIILSQLIIYNSNLSISCETTLENSQSLTNEKQNQHWIM